MSRPFKYEASWSGILRILLWTVAFLYAAGTLLPPPPAPAPYLSAAATKDVRLVAAIHEDPRYVNKLPRQDGVNVYWVMDSTGGVFHTLPDQPRIDTDFALIPKLVHDRLQDKKLSFDVNIQPYLGGIENVSAIAAAINAKPDMIVAAISPIGLFNSFEIVQRPMHLNMASGLWAQHAETLPWMPVFFSPANHLWSAAGSRLPAIRDSSLYKGLIDGWVEAHLHGAKPDGAGSNRMTGGIGRGLTFWVCTGQLNHECPKVIDPKGRAMLDLRDWYREIMKLSDITAGKGVTRRAWDHALAILKDSGIPTLIYELPLDHADVQKDPEAGKKLEQFEQLMAEYRGQTAGTNIHIIERVPEDVVSTIRFRPGDSAHIRVEGEFPAWLAGEVRKVLQEHKLAEAAP